MLTPGYSVLRCYVNTAVLPDGHPMSGWDLNRPLWGES